MKHDDRFSLRVLLKHGKPKCDMGRDERLRLYVNTRPSILSCIEIAHLVVLWEAVASGAEDDHPDDLERDVARALEDACLRGTLKARPHRRGTYEDHAGRTDELTTFYVHRDDARRYFAALDLVPPSDSYLAVWLRGPDAEARSERVSSQDMADFQCACLEQWKRNPTQTITGEGGVVAAVGVSYLRLYKQNTLEKWARAVAPDLVKSRRGRPRKSDGTEK